MNLYRNLEQKIANVPNSIFEFRPRKIKHGLFGRREIIKHCRRLNRTKKICFREFCVEATVEVESLEVMSEIFFPVSHYWYILVSRSLESTLHICKGLKDTDGRCK